MTIHKNTSSRTTIGLTIGFPRCSVEYLGNRASEPYKRPIRSGFRSPEDVLPQSKHCRTTNIAPGSNKIMLFNRKSEHASVLDLVV